MKGILWAHMGKANLPDETQSDSDTDDSPDGAVRVAKFSGNTPGTHTIKRVK